LSASGGMVVVTDPAAGKIHVVNGQTMAVLRSVDVPGAPFDVAVVGATEHDH
jgi:DNA-binding beta-propeller fold protein YncE